MTTPTQGEHAQTEAQPIQRFEVVDCIDSKHVPAVIPRKDGPWVRYEDHAAELRRLHAQVAALTAERPVAPATIPRAYSGRERGAYEAGWDDGFDHGKRTAAPAQPAAPQGVAYAELPKLFREALAWGMTYGPEIPAHQWEEMRESMVKQYTERASNGQAPASRITVEQVEDAIGLQSTAWDTIGAEKIVEAVLRLANGQAPAGATDDRDQKCFCFGSMCEHCAPKRPTAQAAPAAGAVAGPSLQRLHNLLYTAQITTGETQRIAINAARVELSNLRSKAAEPIASRLSCEQIEAMPVWCNYVGLWPESRREIVEAVEDMLAAAPTTAAQADSVLEDAAPSKCSINRYCHANMCLETDADHETDCPQGHAARKQGGKHD